MVAYSFRPQFIDPIQSREKLQTVRGHRPRHARPGELVQLYTGMRTKHCRKIVEADPTCLTVLPIQIFVDALWPRLITGIAVDGAALTDLQIEEFALQDGFRSNDQGSARVNMGAFWLSEHGRRGEPRIEFDGVCIRWGWPHG